MNVRQALKNTAGRFGGKAAVIFSDQTISYASLKETVSMLAGSLQASGIKKGDKVAIYLPNCPHYIYCYLALFSIGAVVVPLDFMLTQKEVTDFVAHSDSRALIAGEKKGVDLAAVKSACPLLEKIIFFSFGKGEGAAHNEFLPLQELLSGKTVAKEEPINDSDHAAIFYTSGSTGHPKGVLLTYGHLDNPVNCIESFLHVTDKDSYLCPGVPFSHLGGLDYMLFMVYFGSTLILMDRFNPIESLKNIEKYKPTVFCVVPPMFAAILSLKECEKFDLSALRYPVVFGAPSVPSLLKRFHQLCPSSSLRNGWGMTETAAPNSYSPDDFGKINSIGPLGLGMEGKIVDDSGNAVPDGQKGELWVKGKAVMVGYYKEDELTREVMTDDGWLKTGDIAIRDKDGLFYLVGRKKEMIKVAGEIVFAPEVEAVIHRHPKVKEVAVIGIPDKVRGEVPLAFIVAKEEQALASDEVRAFCREQIAHFKIPRIQIKADLPKTPSGKIDKAQLQKEVSVAAQ